MLDLAPAAFWQEHYNAHTKQVDIGAFLQHVCQYKSGKCTFERWLRSAYRRRHLALCACAEPGTCTASLPDGVVVHRIKSGKPRRTVRHTTNIDGCRALLTWAQKIKPSYLTEQRISDEVRVHLVAMLAARRASRNASALDVLTHVAKSSNTVDMD